MIRSIYNWLFNDKVDIFDNNSRQILKIAHRGYCTEKDNQNTLISFANAIHHDFNIIELDIQLCKTGEMIVYHDLFINNIAIKNINCDDLPTHIPTLNDVFSNIDISINPLYLDLKGEALLSEVLYKYLIKNHLHLIDNIYIASFNTQHLNIFKNSTYDFNLGFITGNTFQENELIPILEKLNFICIHWTMLEKKMIDVCKNMCVKVFTYTCKTQCELSYILNYRIDGIVSDIKLQL